MEEGDLRRLEVRRRIVEEVARFPGLHLRELARRLDTSVARIEYHLPLLVEAGLVQERHDRGLLRLFPGGASGHPVPAKEDQDLLVLLRDRRAVGLVLAILDTDGGLRHRDLAQRLGMGPSLVSFHLAKLVRKGVVAKRADGTYHVRHKPRVLRVLLLYEPLPDAREAFARLWLDLYERAGPAEPGAPGKAGEEPGQKKGPQDPALPGNGHGQSPGKRP